MGEEMVREERRMEKSGRGKEMGEDGEGERESERIARRRRGRRRKASGTYVPRTSY